VREQEILGYRYRLVDELGAGGMGVVWRAYDEVLDRHVAVKVLAPEFARDAEFRQRVLTEARAAGRLAHPHIAGVYDYGESMTDVGDRVPYVVMELLQGRSLHDRLKRGPVTVEQALRICAEVASALAAAHAHGLVHRDVKPGNVMLTPSGAKVVDFGLAAVAGERDAADGTELMLGTPAYLAPERLAGQPVVAGTDVYALGLLLYRMLAGRAPWSTETTTQMLHAHVYFQPDPLPRVRGVPPVVTDLVHRCLVKDPGGRPSSREVAATLAHAAGIRVPLDLVDDDDLADPHGDHGQSSGGRDSGGSGGSGRGKATVRPDPLAPLPPGLVSAGDPFVLRLGKHLDSTLDHVTLRRQASVLLRGVVPFDLAIWAVLDPVTLMWASCVVDGGPYDERFEHELFANEYGQDDVLRLVDLAEGPRVGTLLAGTQGDPRTSRRFRNILQPRGFTDELRLAFYDNDGTWGALLLFRVGGQFTEADVAQLAPAARPFGSVLHQTLVRGDPPTEVPQPDIATPPKSSASRSIRIPMPRRGRGRRAARPESRGAPPESAAPVAAPVAGRRTPVTGQVTISGDGRLLDVTEGARALLDAVQLDRVGAAVARGRTLGLVDATASGRHDGRWLAFHARPQRTSIDVTVGRIRPHQVSEFVTRSLGLEPWHFRLLGAVARNRDTRQIAQDLEMSAYDVQDGMVSLFSAFGVTGRIELVKALFFDHYVPMHAADARVSPD
jgi:Protein kinase domain